MTLTKLMIQRLFVVYLVTVLILHVMKTDDVVDLNNFLLGIRMDHWTHGILFSPMGFFALTSFSNNIRLAFGIIVFCCLFFEILQYFIPYRSFDVWDIVADSIGASIGILFYYGFRKWLPGQV